MSYYNRYKNKKKFDNNNNGGRNGSPNNNNDNNSPMQAGLSVPDAIFDIGKNKRVTVRQFRNINLIDIREYYMDNSTGEMKPGKKGISLTEDLYDEFLKHRLNIDEALRRLGSKRPRTKMVIFSSDDEDDYEDENNKDSKRNGDKSSSSKHDKDGEDKKESSMDEQREKKRKKGDKKNPAEPSLLMTEEKKHLEEREARAVLIVPSLANSTIATKTEEPTTIEEPITIEEQTTNEQITPELEQPKIEPKKEADDELEIDTKSTNSNDASDSDEEFAKHLDDEMNKVDDDVSEEE